MTTELKAIRKKRATSEANPASSEGNHRKRRRNRTTQSCLSCHTSKRMCDRKRPCGRCTQLGLTGLCVYEVDDASKRTDVQEDESLRLRQRVAELEGVIRELKNKPHPRWAQAVSTESEFQKWHARSQSRSTTEQQQTEHQSETKSTSPSRSVCSNSGPGDESHPSPQVPSPPHPHPADLTNSSVLCSPYFSGVSCPLSTPSPCIMTPIDEYTHTQAFIAGEQPLTGEFDFSSIFMSYPGLIGFENSPGYDTPQVAGDVFADHLDDTCRFKTRGHCGCLTERSSYDVVLELSLRLRKAADILLGSGNCSLNQRIFELDALATMALGNITSPSNDINQKQPFSHLFIPPSSNFGTTLCRTMPASTASPHNLQEIRSNVLSSVSDDIL
ncbi:hypothetical protein DEU56DRAFT_792909 [Suillus clintonianus]|uniref:uncharacterized protein n=1 Tax=Suillus clintonianus TaxID=1904413 RepID=UPI001B85DEA8|nr:uncharacterized protein DEU56DRAFT_792909 [Suillus clintonianus]KAG2143001.1 hypothetical protein DEU56DRAFT_792909 [Suillus clintonianus]